MSNNLIYNNTNLYDIIIDGNGGINQSANSSFFKFINMNTCYKNLSENILSIIYYDAYLNEIKLIYGLENNLNFSIITKVDEPIIDLIASVDNDLNYTIYYIDSTKLHYISKKYSINTSILLKTLNINMTVSDKVSLKKYIAQTENNLNNSLFMLSIGSNIYNLLINNNISANLIINDYNGEYYYPYVYQNNRYVVYTSDQTVVILNLTFSYTINQIGNIIFNQLPTKPSIYFQNSDLFCPTSCLYVSNMQNLPISISFWFNILESNDLSIKQSILGLVNNTIINNGLDIRAYNGGISVTIQMLDKIYEINSKENLYQYNKWNHCCLTIDSNFNTILYLNNSLIGSVNINDNLINYSTIIIGGYNNLIRGYNGFMYDFMVFNKSLSINEVNKIYNFSLIDISNRIIYIPMTNPEDIQNNYSIVGILKNTDQIYINPKLVGINNLIELIIVNSKNNYVYSTTIDNYIISLNSRLNQCDNYTPINLKNKDTNNKDTNNISLFSLLNSKLSEIILNNGSMKYDNIIDNKDYLINNFDIIYLNSLKYIAYISNDNKLHLLYESNNIIKIIINYFIENITISDNLYPIFSKSISDYFIVLNNTNKSIITINNNDYITKQLYLNQFIHITDNINNYYIKIIQNDLLVHSDTSVGHGIYATQTSNNYYIIYDQNNVPLWYHKNTLNNTIINSISNSQKYYLFLENTQNDNNINVYSNFYPKTIVNINTLERFDLVILNNLNNNFCNFNLYNAIQSIESNTIIPSDSNGFYLQIQNSDNKIVWEFFFDEFLKNENSYEFEISAIDINSINSNIAISLKNLNALICINYNTKKIIWIYDPSNTLKDLLISPNNIVFLTPSNLPSNQFLNYIPVSIIHDIRWIDNNIFIYQNEIEFNRSRSDGFKIDLKNKNLVWITQTYTENCPYNFNNTFKIINNTNPFAKYLNWLNTSPSFVEYYSTINTENNSIRKIIKDNKSLINIKKMRNTSGLFID
jgi:hypothetical protein